MWPVIAVALLPAGLLPLVFVQAGEPTPGALWLAVLLYHAYCFAIPGFFRQKPKEAGFVRGDVRRWGRT
ncbi:MAG: hypothetical protein ACYTAF_10600, partial [Planctomycetota bacterium]